MNEYEVERGASFTSEKTRVQTLRHTETSQVKYDLIGKITEGTSLTRKTVSAILQSINIKNSICLEIILKNLLQRLSGLSMSKKLQ